MKTLRKKIAALCEAVEGHKTFADMLNDPETQRANAEYHQKMQAKFKAEDELAKEAKNWPDDKELTYEEALALAKAYYAQGGDGFYETTEKYQFDDEVKMFGPMTVGRMKRDFGVFDSVATNRMSEGLESKTFTDNEEAKKFAKDNKGAITSVVDDKLNPTHYVHYKSKKDPVGEAIEMVADAEKKIHSLTNNESIIEAADNAPKLIDETGYISSLDNTVRRCFANKIAGENSEGDFVKTLPANKLSYTRQVLNDGRDRKFSYILTQGDAGLDKDTVQSSDAYEGFIKIKDTHKSRENLSVEHSLNIAESGELVYSVTLRPNYGYMLYDPHDRAFRTEFEDVYKS